MSNMPNGPVWRYFEEISAIPRGSGNEKGISEYILNWAEQRKLQAKKDKTGNIVIMKKGSSGREGDAPLALQGHLDMVCEKNADVKHDFTKDPIRLVRNGDWLTADGTTLGADNGIAVAMIMALLENDEVDHPPLEALFTVDEESGMTGAFGLKKDFISAARLINLDSEEEGYFYIGCAGGVHTNAVIPLKPIPVPRGFDVMDFAVKGLNGGHSGMEINKGYGNAIIIAGKLLSDYPGNILLSDMYGGDKANAIPRECYARICTDNADSFISYLENAKMELRELFPLDKDLALEATLCDEKGKSFTEDSSSRILSFLTSVPNGPVSMDKQIPGLVETSTNLASVKIKKNRLCIVSSQRSSDGDELEALKEQIKKAVEDAGGKTEFESGYPGWKPNPHSPLLDKAKKVYADFRGTSPVVTAVHAGLECGLLGQRYPGLDMISFGPDILGAHSPDERVGISSTERTWDFLLELLKAL